MARRGIKIFIVIGFISLLIAISTRVSLTQKKADIFTRTFHFIGVFDSDSRDMLSDDELNEEIESASAIVIVQPTNNIRTSAYAVEQRVKVCEVKRGNLAESSEIWVETDNGLYNGENWGMSNLMYSNHKYMLVLNETDGRYYQQFGLGAIALDMKKNWKTIDVTKEYTYNDLKEYKYFAADKETLKYLYEREEYVLQTIMQL